MSLTQVKNLAQEMKLLGVLSVLDQTLSEAQEERLSISEVLDALLQAEKDYRDQRLIETRMTSSKQKTRPALEDFDFTAKRSITKAQIKELYLLKWCEQGRPLLIFGPTGVGKTFLAEALGTHACRNKITTLFLSVSTFLETLALARSSSSYLKWRDRLSRPQLLVLDDFGLKKLTAEEAHDLAELIKERGTEKSTIITTQLPFTHWKEVIADPVIADTLIDRLIHTLKWTPFSGQSKRSFKV